MIVFVTVILACELDCICNQLKHNLFSTPVWDALKQIIWIKRIHPNSTHSSASPHKRTWRKKTLLSACLPSFLVGILSILFLQTVWNSTSSGFQNKQKSSTYPGVSWTPASVWDYRNIKPCKLYVMKQPFLDHLNHILQAGLTNFPLICM